MIIHLEPIYKDKIWGGSKLKEVYGYPTSNKCGEVWGISALKNNSNSIKNNAFKGKTLFDLFNENKPLFGNYDKEMFPILIKLIYAEKDLSIQVHPDDSYAMNKHNCLGKEESWLILDCDDDTEIILGHNAKSKTEIIKHIDENNIEDIVNKFRIEKEDYFYVKAGALHAICKGTTLLEVQESSDITYRFYDYNRLENNLPRELHIEDALNVVRIPDNENYRLKKDKYFKTENINIVGLKTLIASKHGDYYFVIEGKGLVDDVEISKGDFFFATSESKYTFNGNLKLYKTVY